MNRTLKLIGPMIILLDLNYTTVSSSHRKARPFTKQIEGETYHAWLLDLLRIHQVLLVTARPAKYQEATLRSLWHKARWQPTASFFNEHDLRPAACKRRVVEYLMEHHQLQRFLDEGMVVAIESNPRTRAMYAEFGIPCLQVSKDKQGRAT